MATSGSYVWNPSLDDIINDAYERCGISPDDISSQFWTSAIFSLNGVMAEMTNMQLNLWEVEPLILSLAEDVRSYQLPDGTVDVLEAYRRSFDRVLGGTAVSSAGGTAANAFDEDLDTACTQVSTNGNISYQYSDATVITMGGYQAESTQTLNLVYEGSADGSNWTTLSAPGSKSYQALQIVWVIFQTPGSYTYYRVRETGGGTLNPVEIYFANNEKDYPLGRMSRQDYDGITNKTTVGIPLAYYIDRSINPIMNIYQTPNTTFTMIKYNRIRQLQTVSGATQTLDSPFRFIEAVTSFLAAKLAVKRAPDRLQMLKAEADKSLQLADTEDRERVKATFVPDLSGYRI